MPSDISRRRLMGSGAAALAFAPPLVRAATAPDTPTGSHLGTPARVERIQGAADNVDRLTVETFINDKGPFQFVVDTGADRSCLAEDLAATLGLAPSQDVIVQGIARAMPAKAVQLDDVRIGRVRVSNQPMPLLPRSWLGADGYLGLDIINHQRVTFDFLNHALTIEPSNTDTKWLAMADQALVRVNGSEGRLTAVNGSVDGVKAYIFIDSGAEITIGNSRLFAAMQAQNHAGFVNDDIIQLIGVTGGSAQGRVARIERVKIGSISFTHSALVISDLPVFDIWGLADKPAMFIGMNFLRQTASLSIDYARKELRFRLASNIRLASRV